MALYVFNLNGFIFLNFTHAHEAGLCDQSECPYTVVMTIVQRHAKLNVFMLGY